MNTDSSQASLTPSAGGAVVTGTWGWSDGATVLTFDPEDDLLDGTPYTITVTGADVDGNLLTGKKTFTFATVEVEEVSVYLSPASKTVSTDCEFTIDVMVAEVRNLAGCSFEVHFDPDILSVVDQDTSTPGVVEIAGGTIFEGKSPIVAPNAADNSAGSVKYSVLARPFSRARM
jgi:hypothetical protein